MSEIMIGSTVEIELLESRFKVQGFTKDRMFVPDGWLIDEFGCVINPDDCRLISGPEREKSQEVPA